MGVGAGRFYSIHCCANFFPSVDLLEEQEEFNRLFQIDRGKIASAARYLDEICPPYQMRRPLPWLLFKSFFYGYSGQLGTGERCVDVAAGQVKQVEIIQTIN